MPHAAPAAHPDIDLKTKTTAELRAIFNIHAMAIEHSRAQLMETQQDAGDSILRASILADKLGFFTAPEPWNGA